MATEREGEKQADQESPVGGRQTASSIWSCGAEQGEGGALAPLLPGWPRGLGSGRGRRPRPSRAPAVAPGPIAPRSRRRAGRDPGRRRARPARPSLSSPARTLARRPSARRSQRDPGDERPPACPFPPTIEIEPPGPDHLVPGPTAEAPFASRRSPRRASHESAQLPA